MAFQIYRPDRARAVRGVLFDMDGVVLDTEKLYARFWREAAQEQGYTMSYEQALGMRSLNNEAAISGDPGPTDGCLYPGPWGGTKAGYL